MEWLGKTYSQNRTEFDGEVIVHLELNQKGNRVQFKFRKNSSYKITDGNYVMVARDGDRVYFKEGDASRGFKLGDYGVDTKIFKVKQERFPVSESEMGEYNLEFDSRFGLHYICFKRKLEKSLTWEGK